MTSGSKYLLPNIICIKFVIQMMFLLSHFYGILNKCEIGNNVLLRRNEFEKLYLFKYRQRNAPPWAWNV